MTFGLGFFQSLFCRGQDNNFGAESFFLVY
jgi:hypothetical protein